MLRPIVGFYQDEVGDWVCQLACGHGQHARHKPPFIQRPWTQTAEGRASMLGHALVCQKCQRRERPLCLLPVSSQFCRLPVAEKQSGSVTGAHWLEITLTEGAMRCHWQLAEQQEAQVLTVGQGLLLAPGSQFGLLAEATSNYLIEEWRVDWEV